MFQAGRTLLRQMLGQFSEFFFAGTSCSVPRQTMRLSVSTFQLSPRIEHDCCSSLNFFTTLVYLSVSGICDLTSLSLVMVSSTWTHLRWERLWLSGRIRLLLEGFWLTLGNRPWKKFRWTVLTRFSSDCVIFRHLVRSVICTSRRAFRPKSVSCVLVYFHPLLWMLSPEKS